MIIQLPHEGPELTQYMYRYRAFRLLSLQLAPEAFSSTFAREAVFSDEQWMARLQNPIATTFVAVGPDGSFLSTLTMVGPLGDGSKTPTLAEDGSAHVAAQAQYRINAVFTHPQARRGGWSSRLIESSRIFAETQAEAQSQEAVVTVAVELDNAAAKVLYERAGFVGIRYERTPGSEREIMVMQYQP